jgi:hypothetical protein
VEERERLKMREGRVVSFTCNLLIAVNLLPLYSCLLNLTPLSCHQSMTVMKV